MNVWEEILQKIETKVNRHSFNTWFRPTRLLAESGQSLSILVPNAHFRDWLNKHYSGVILESLDELHRPDIHVVFETARVDAVPSEPAPTPPAFGSQQQTLPPLPTTTPPTPNPNNP